MKIATVFTFLAVLALMQPGLLLAQQEPYGDQMIRVSPAIHNIGLIPGSSQTYTVNVENLLERPLPLQVSVEGFGPADEDGGMTFDNPQDRSPLISWVTVSQKDMILQANEKRDVMFTVAVPNTVPLGGYYAVLFFSPLIAASQSVEQTLVLPRIGVLLLSQVGVQEQLLPEQRANIETFVLSPKVSEDGQVSGLVRVKNMSLGHFVAQPTLLFKPIVIGQAKEIAWEEKTILPGKVRRWEKSLGSERVPFGLYKVAARIAIGNGESVTKETYLVVVAYKAAVILIGATGFLVLVLFYRTRIKRALRILFTKGT